MKTLAAKVGQGGLARKCEICEGVVTRKPASNKTPKFCSQSCRGKAIHKLNWNASDELTAACSLCGADFTQKKRQGRPRKHCSDQCRNDYYNSGTVQDRERQLCAQCGESFAHLRLKKYCSAGCSDEAIKSFRYRYKQMGYKQTKYKKSCPCCDQEFSGESKQVCCSRHCGGVYRHGMKLKDYVPGESKRRNGRKRNQVRRAIKYGAESESFCHEEIFKRDGYNCQSCGIKTRPSFKYTNKKRPELDHIVPLSKGGPHTRKNTQCLCRGCNMSKGSSTENQQLRLI